MNIALPAHLSALSAFAVAASLGAADASGQALINDNFVDGLPQDTGSEPLESDFYTTSSSAALSDSIATPGFLDFVTGTSGRAIHTLFTPQTLAAEGDQIVASYTFTTPATVGTNEDFRVALFNTLGEPGLAADVNASSSSPNSLLNNLPGVAAEFDINTADADFAVRTHDVNAVNGSGPTGRGLTTTTGFDFRQSGDDLGFAIDANTVYTGTLALELDANGDIVVTQTLVGGSVNETFVANAIAVADTVDGDAGVNTTTFDFLGLYNTSGAFGSSNSVGDPDNGIDLTNVSVTFVPGTPIPEPGSMALLAGGAGLLLARRRGR